MLDKKKKRIVMLSILILLILSILFFKSVITVNNIYRLPKETIHQMNVPLKVPKNTSLEFYVKDAHFIASTEVSQFAPNFHAQSKDNGLSYTLISVTLSVNNKSDSEQNIEALMMAMLTVNDTYSNGVSLPTMLEVNNGEITQNIAAQQTDEITLYYAINKNSLSKQTYKRLSSQNFYYTYQLSPDVERVQLLFN